tara:strand:+ start:68 stop:985 length:918 start_codon:yes stop_codon:yes gene_type:complete
VVKKLSYIAVKPCIVGVHVDTNITIIMRKKTPLNKKKDSPAVPEHRIVIELKQTTDFPEIKIPEIVMPEVKTVEIEGVKDLESNIRLSKLKISFDKKFKKLEKENKSLNARIAELEKENKSSEEKSELPDISLKGKKIFLEEHDHESLRKTLAEEYRIFLTGAVERIAQFEDSDREGKRSYERTEFKEEAISYVDAVYANPDYLKNPDRATDGIECLVESFLDPLQRPRIPKEVYNSIMRRDQECLRCGSRKRLQLDHIKAWFKGGSSRRYNLQILCQSCNMVKGANYADFREDYVKEQWGESDI